MEQIVYIDEEYFSDGMTNGMIKDTAKSIIVGALNDEGFEFECVEDECGVCNEYDQSNIDIISFTVREE